MGSIESKDVFIPLRLLIIEDSEDDTLLVMRELQRLGYQPIFERVETPEAMKSALQQDTWDIVLSDYFMPHFSAPEALRLLEEGGFDTPFIIISGSIQDETAVAAMNAGAHDYMMKDNLARLGPAIERELKEAEERRRRRQAELALRQSEERFRQMAENVQEVFWMSDPSKNELLYLSPSFEKVWGRSCESLYRNPKSLLDSIHPDDFQRVSHIIDQQPFREYEEEYRIVKPDGTVRWIRDRAFPIKDSLGRIYRFAGVVEDITDRKLDADAIRYSAYYDSLTKLPNRTLLLDRLQQAIIRGVREKKALAFLLVGLNRYSEVNDTLGSSKGDLLLQHVGTRLKETLRGSDTVARLEKDQFGIVLPDTGDGQNAMLVSLKILSVLDSPFKIEDLTLEVGGKIGIALSPRDAKEVDLLIQKADEAMYVAKETGVGCTLYSP